MSRELQYGEGFDDFARAVLPRLLRMAHLLTGNPHDAWDLTQATIERVGLSWGRVSQVQHPAGYAARTMVRLNVSRWRRVRRELLTATTPEQGREVSFESVELAPQVAALLASLGPRQRAVVVLRFYSDLPHADIADIMGCSVGTVKSQLSRALKSLRSQLDDEAEQRVGNPGKANQ